jgi:hypothetical protein
LLRYRDLRLICRDILLGRFVDDELLRGFV